MNALLDRDVDAAQAMTYNEWAQILEVIDPETGELYQPEDFNVVSYADTQGAMLQDAIWADTERLESDPAYADAAVRFLREMTISTVARPRRRGRPSTGCGEMRSCHFCQRIVWPSTSKLGPSG